MQQRKATEGLKEETMHKVSFEKQTDSTCLKLKDIMGSETSHSQRTNTVWFQWYEVARLNKYIETECRMVVARGWEREEMGVSILQDEKVLETGYTMIWIYLTLLSLYT